MEKAEKFDSEKPMLDLLHPSLITTYYGGREPSLEAKVLLGLANIAHARDIESCMSRIFIVLQEIIKQVRHSTLHSERTSVRTFLMIWLHRTECQELEADVT